MLDIATKDTQSTPLMIAATCGNVNAVEQLARSGASVDARDKLGCTSLMIACQRGEKSVCETLLDFGADLLAVDKRKQNVLHWAFCLGHTRLGKWFAGQTGRQSRGSTGREMGGFALLHGIDIDGNTPLFYLPEQSIEQIVLKAGFMKRQEEQHNTASMLPVVRAPPPPECARAAHTEP